MSENDEKNILGKKLKRKENDNDDINNNQKKSCYFCHSLSENFFECKKCKTNYCLFCLNKNIINVNEKEKKNRK
jgi:hypothetical protein